MRSAGMLLYGRIAIHETSSGKIFDVLVCVWQERGCIKRNGEVCHQEVHSLRGMLAIVTVSKHWYRRRTPFALAEV